MSIDQNKIKRCLLFTCRVLSSLHHTDLVVMVPVFARQESQVSREALDPRDRQALPVHQARKAPRDHVETEARQGNQEITGPKAPRDLQGHQGRKGQRVHRAQGELKVTPALKEAKVLQVPRDPQERWEVIGNNAFGKILTTEGTLD